MNEVLYVSCFLCMSYLMFLLVVCHNQCQEVYTRYHPWNVRKCLGVLCKIFLGQKMSALCACVWRGLKPSIGFSFNGLNGRVLSSLPSFNSFKVTCWALNWAYCWKSLELLQNPITVGNILRRKKVLSEFSNNYMERLNIKPQIIMVLRHRLPNPFQMARATVRNSLVHSAN